MNKTGKPRDVAKYALMAHMYALCLSIEELPASEKQTDLSIKASDFMDEIWNYYEEKPNE